MSKWNIVSGVSCCDSASEYEPSERYVREGVKYLTFTSDMIKKNWPEIPKRRKRRVT